MSRTRLRPIPTLAVLAICAALVGCETFRWGLFRPNGEPSGLPLSGVPSAESLVSYLNDNSRRLQSLRCTDIDITASQRFASFSLRGQMMTMKSRNFLMTATALGSPMIDLGSNENEFWFWASKADPPYQFYCSYKDYEDGRVAKLPFPFQPEWIMEAFGMGNYGPAEKLTVESDAKSVRLVERTRSPQGQAIRKVIAMNRRPVSAPSPQVTGFYLLDDATQKEICSAQILEVHLDPISGALVPRKLQLNWPAESAKLTMTLNGMNVNPQLNVASFQRQPLQGVKSFDLARAGGGVQRARSISP